MEPDARGLHRPLAVPLLRFTALNCCRGPPAKAENKQALRPIVETWLSQVPYVTTTSIPTPRTNTSSSVLTRRPSTTRPTKIAGGALRAPLRWIRSGTGLSYATPRAFGLRRWGPRGCIPGCSARWRSARPRRGRTTARCDPVMRFGLLSPLRREGLDPPNEGQDNDGPDTDSDEEEVLPGDVAEDDAFVDEADVDPKTEGFDN